MPSLHNCNSHKWPSTQKIRETRRARRNAVVEWMLAQTADGAVLYQRCSDIAKQCGCTRQLVAATLLWPETAAHFTVTKASYRCYRIERRVV